MRIHVNMIEDSNGDLVDIEYFCSPECYEIHTGGEAFGHAWPGGSETDYDVLCAHCDSLLWKGLQTDDEADAVALGIEEEWSDGS